MGRLSRLAVKAAKKAATKAEKAAVKAAESAPELRAKAKVSRLAVKPKALPAPKRPLALPPPEPGLPDFAAKPKGGQWWTEGSPFAVMNPAASSKENIYLGARFSSDPTDKALAEWWDKALPRYIQNDFATPDDPLRALADQGYLQGVENAAQWSNRVKRDIVPMPLQKLLFDPKTAETGVRDETLAAMPWVNKMPATENIYGFWPREETIGALSHIRDEMVNALKPDSSGLPADLAVRPESLGRMSFAQAAERVGLINQWRAKQAEQAALSAMDSPVVHTFKEYAEDNPMGLRWVEMAPPKGDGPSNYDVEEELQRALKYEGDTMGHCVGGYCPDVMSGRSRIFSLRDAKGEPHVTIETSPRDRNGAALEHIRSLGVYPDWVKYSNSNRDMSVDAHDLSARFLDELGLPQVDYSGQDIIQIKGKQNRAPKDDYLPFVQDFVKSGQWGNIGDLDNTGLVKLPDGRYITDAQYAEAAAKAYGSNAPIFSADLNRYGMPDEEWARIAQHFEGYAIGGRVDPDRCFCRHPLSAKRKK